MLVSTLPGRRPRLLEDGFVTLPGMLKEIDVGRVRCLVDEVHREQRTGGCERANNELVPLRWNDAVVEYLLCTTPLVEAVRHATHARDMRWISAYISVRPAKTGELPWHQDWWCWDHPVTYRQAPVQVAVLCYLDDVGPTNAALQVLPGSHRRATSMHKRLTDSGCTAGSSPSPHGALTLPARPGDVVVLDYRLLHATTSNTTSRSRDGVLLSFTPAWNELPPEVRGHFISHPALPRPEEQGAADVAHAALLPSFDSPRRDLQLNRRPPRRFSIPA